MILHSELCSSSFYFYTIILTEVFIGEEYCSVCANKAVLHGNGNGWYFVAKLYNCETQLPVSIS